MFGGGSGGKAVRATVQTLAKTAKTPAAAAAAGKALAQALATAVSERKKELRAVWWKLLRRWVVRPFLTFLFYRSIVVPLLRRLWARVRFGRWSRPSTWLHCAAANRDEFTKHVPAAADYRPTPWLIGGALQTISAEIPQRWRAGSLVPYVQRTTFELPARKRPPSATCCPAEIPEGVVSVDWAEGSPSASQADATFIVVPGLTGGSNSAYVRRCVSTLARAAPGRYRVGGYSPRGSNGNELKNSFMYSGGYTEDLRHVLQRLGVPRGGRLFVIAYSLGANVTAKLLAEDGPNSPVTAAVVCACPVDMLPLSNYMSYDPWGKIWDRVLVQGCNSLLRRSPVLQKYAKEMECARNYDWGDHGAPSMRLFDDTYIAPMMGCSGGAAQYYRAAASGPLLHRIRRPTLFVHARNDPIVDFQRVRTDDFKFRHLSEAQAQGSGKYLYQLVTVDGAHSMDWPTGWGAHPWSAKVALQFLRMVESRGDIRQQKDRLPSFAMMGGGDGGDDDNDDADPSGDDDGGDGDDDDDDDDDDNEDKGGNSSDGNESNGSNNNNNQDGGGGSGPAGSSGGSGGNGGPTGNRRDSSTHRQSSTRGRSGNIRKSDGTGSNDGDWTLLLLQRQRPLSVSRPGRCNTSEP